ncbi:hypothetical protein VKT23_005034 [Stygiomarasmius scandens]|uniref:Uncharacterized protein n=1 Tax=Marasmiellus scandens TaxID=2682957 RepID=A0ABR1JWG9_9AGAR
MVVNKKQSLSQAPGMGSRTSSSQNLSRNKHTTNAKNVPTVAGPSTAKKTSKAAKKATKVKKESGPSWMDRFMLILLTLFSTYAFWTCPSDERLVNPVCRSLSQYRTHVLEPYVLPPIHNALSHPSVAPVVSKIHAAERAVTPVIVRAYTISQPYTSRINKLTQSAVNHTYKKLVYPQYERYVLPQYRKLIAPYVQQLSDRIVDPYLSPIVVNAHLYTNKAFVYLHRVYTTVQPHVHALYVRTKPHAQSAWTAARPYIGRAAESVQTLLAILMEKLGQMRRLYVDPHVLRIWDKVVELSGPARTTLVPAAGETKATSVAPTKSSWSSKSTAATTSPSSVTKEPETESIVPEETLSVVEPEETETEASVNAEAEEVLSASSVVAETISPSVPVESAPAAEESLIEDVEEAVEEIVVNQDDEEVQETSTTSSAIAESVSSSVAPVVPETDPSLADSAVPEESLSEDDELLLFLGDLGISDDADGQPDVESSTNNDLPIEVTPTNQTPEEALASQIAVAAEMDRQAREARKDQTAAKRKTIEDRHRRWAYGLDELVHRKLREVRKELVKLRKDAVKSLGLPESKAKKEQEDEENQETELEEELTHIDGEVVSGLLVSVEREGDKLLKGLEGYLKKEEKDTGPSKPEPRAEDRLRKWMSVSEKVRSKFSDKVTEMQEKVHRWYRGVRDLEVQGCMAAATEIKNYAEGAQADLGLDYAWLDDVTYQDWQKYHDLMREFRKFEEEVQLIQNGSHANPPVDPLIPALDKLQVELEDIVNGFEARIRILGTKIREALFGLEADVGTAGTSQPKEENEQVSILPIDPVPSVPSSPGDTDTDKTTEFDASNVILGKSKEQVEEALKGVTVEPRVHEEL